MVSLSNLPSTTAILSTYTTFAASAMLVRTMLNEVQNMTNHLLPRVAQEKILSKFGSLFGNLSPQITLIVDEYNGHVLNQVFEASETYLRTKISDSNERLLVAMPQGDNNLSITVNKGEKIIDTFEGIQLKWEMIFTESQKTSTDYEGSFTSEIIERKSFELTFDKKYKEKVINSYLPFLMDRLKAIKEERKVVKLYSLGDHFGDLDFKHPSTFNTLAMDPALKKEIIDDLDRFMKRRDYYRRVGKAWKRGYLLYGPPGTGKSSLIAAMANYLKFNVYDFELTNIGSNSELRRLLVYTQNRSIIVIEDIDCSVELHNRQGDDGNNNNQFTLSGLLNFIDGLWSTCGDERIIVFTTNHKDKLDPALLRPGRMDKHILMSYCTPSGFKILASNYLGIRDHSMFDEIEKLVSEVEATPAEIAEELMKSDDVDTALGGLVEFLRRKKSGSFESNGGEEKEFNDGNGNGKEESKKGTEKKGRKNKRKARRGKSRK